MPRPHVADWIGATILCAFAMLLEGWHGPALAADQCVTEAVYTASMPDSVVRHARTGLPAILFTAAVFEVIQAPRDINIAATSTVVTYEYHGVADILFFDEGGCEIYNARGPVDGLRAMERMLGVAA